MSAKPQKTWYGAWESTWLTSLVAWVVPLEAEPFISGFKEDGREGGVGATTCFILTFLAVVSATTSPPDASFLFLSLPPELLLHEARYGEQGLRNCRTGAKVQSLDYLARDGGEFGAGHPSVGPASQMSALDTTPRGEMRRFIDSRTRWLHRP